MIFVTGGSGFLGAHLLAHLTRKHDKIRALYRNRKGLENVREVFGFYFNDEALFFDKIEWIQGDLNDNWALSNALVGVTSVYHVAGLINFEWRRHRELKSTNIKGTANLVDHCLQAKVDKLCYISSIAAMGNNPQAHEADLFERPKFSDPYGMTKYAGELEIWRGAQEGLKVFIVRPGVILGEGYWRSGSGFLLKFVSTEPRWYPPGSTGFVDVKDVVDVTIDLMNRPEHNLVFTLVGHNLTYLEVLQKIGKALGSHKPPKWSVPLWVGLLGHYADFLRASITGKPQRLPKAYVQAMFESSTYDGTPVSKHLNIPYRTLEHTLERICQWAPYRLD